MWGLTGFKLYAIAGLALALLISLGANRYQHGKVESLRTDLATAKATLDSVASANLNQAAALDQCLESNAQWMSLGKGVAALKADLAALDKARTERDAANRLLAERRQNATPECKALLETDFGRVCGRMSDSLRERASENH